VTSTPAEQRRVCKGLRSDGEPCRAYAVEDSDYCRLHSLTPEERKQSAKKAAKASAFRRRARHEAQPRSGLADGVSLATVAEAVAPALVATFPHDGSPDWSARLAAAGTLLLAFPRSMRQSPEKVRELLERCLPEQVFEDMGDRMEADRVYRALRAEWLEAPRWSPTRGLFWDDLPRELVAPWEDYATVVKREVPADVPPDQAPIVHTADGRVLRLRPGKPPLLLQTP
jgi:hypothetical protein